MFAVLKNTTYRHLFLAQVISLIGTGLSTVALGLLAFDLAGENAGAVLGTAFAIKMIAYVSLTPIAGAFADVLPRRIMLVGLNVARALKQDILNLAERQRVTDVHHIRETNNFG
jgi:MFS family permease